MKKNNKRKFKAFLLSLLYSVSLVCLCTSSSKRETDANKDKLYIGTLDEIVENYDPNSEYLAYIIDERYDKDPNIEIYNSYMIDNYNDMKKVINMLLELEESNPTKWDRTYESMINEWFIHNLFYKLNFLKKRSGCVDLNNADEEIYSKVLMSLLYGKFDDDFLQLENDFSLKLTK